MPDVTPSLATLGATGWTCNESFVPKPVALSDALPVSEATTPVPGAMPLASRGDHTHKRISTSVKGTTDVNGEATLMFARTFDTAPTTFFSYEETADNQPINIKRKAWVMGSGATAGLFVGVVVKAYRAQALPALTSIILIGPLITALQSFNVFAGAANGVAVEVVALPTG